MRMRDRVASWVLLFLSFAPFLIAFVAIQFLPDQIPAHYNALGEIDRWGSKYEEFVLAVAFSLSGWILWLMARFSGCFADNEEELAKAKANAKVIVVVGIAVQLLMCILQIVLAYGAYKEASMGAAVSVLPIWKIMGIGIGLLYIVIGNIMPKAKPNNLMGVRTPWSRSSPEAWAKSQRQGGITFAIAGALCVVLSLVLHGFAIFWVVMACSLIAAVIACVLSFRAAQ